MSRVAAIAAATLVGTALAVAAGWLGWRAVRLLTREDLTVSDEAVALQALGGAAALAASLVLVGVTAWYVILTAKMVAQAGPVVTAALEAAWLSGGQIAPGYIHGPLAKLGASSGQEFYNVPALAVRLRNEGNGPAKVESVSVRFDGGLSLTEMERPTIGDVPPFTLGGHDSKVVFIEALKVAAVVAASSPAGLSTRRMRAEVLLGSGKTVVSKWHDVPRGVV